MKFRNLDKFEFTVIQLKLRVLYWWNSVYRSVGLVQEVEVFTKKMVSSG